MIQNAIALLIVFSAAAISLYSLVKSLVVKKVSKCDGCSGCELKNLSMAKPGSKTSSTRFRNLRILHENEKRQGKIPVARQKVPYSSLK